MKRQGKKGKYIYCIIKGESPQRYEVRGIGDGEVHTIHFMDLAAVVSDSPVEKYDIARRNVMAHELVIEHVMQHHTVLPVRFGTVAKAEDIVEKLLKRRFGEFHGLLNYFEDKVELGLKIFWKQEAMFAEIVESRSEIRALRDALQGKNDAEARYQRIQLGEMVAEALLGKRDDENFAVMEELRPLAVESKSNKILSDSMVVNAAFLVTKEREAEFDAKVQEIDARNVGRLILKFVGPVPPFNFAIIVVQWDEKD